MPWTQVDADFQIQNLPPPGGGFIYMGSNPDTAPFTTSPLRFDQGAGFAITSGLAQLRLASLSQQGVIGTAGYQQIQGPTFFVGNPAAGVVPPLTGHSWGGILQDGGLGFYTTSEGALTALNAGITYGPFGLLNFTCKHSMLWGAGTVATPAAMQFKNLYALSEIDLDSSGNVTHTFNNIFRAVSLPPPATLSWGPFSPPGTYLLDLESFDSPGPSYSLQAGTLVGQWGTDGLGNTFSGGILTGFAGSPSLPWSAITGTPVTFTGYGLTTPILPGDAAGGDLSGTFPDPSVAQIAGFPLLISSPASGDVLTWNGTDWLNQPPAGGGGVTIGASIGGGTANQVLYGDGSVQVQQSSDLAFDQTTGLTVTIAPYLTRLGNSAGVNASDGSNAGILCNGSYGVWGVKGVFGVSAGSFWDGTHTVNLADGTNAIGYTAGNPADWAGGVAPTDVWVALDRLAAACNALGHQA